METNRARSLSRKQAIVLLIATTGFLAIYVGLYIPYVIAILSSPSQIVKFDFRDNDWFEAEDVRIVNQFRSGTIEPNDELAYEISFKNKIDESIIIQSRLEILVGGLVVKTIEGEDDLSLGSSETKSKRIIFHLEESGENQVRLVANILNATDSSALDTVATTINVDVPSREELFQSRALTVTMIGVLVSVIIGAITILLTAKNTMVLERHTNAALRQNTLTLEQLKILKNEATQTLRPWIGRSDFEFEGVVWDDNKFTAKDEFENEKEKRLVLGSKSKTTHHRFIFWIQNYGHIPATKCFAATRILPFQGKQEEYKNPDLVELDKLTFKEPIAIMPNEKVPIRFDIPIELVVNSTVMCRIKYEYPGGIGFYDWMVRYNGSNWIPIYNKAT